MNPLIQLKKAAAVFLIALVLNCFGLPSSVQAVSPPPDGGYPGNNTAEGDGALLLLTTGGKNTASGFRALFANTTGSDNTASGAAALFANTTGGDNTANGFSALSQNTTGGNNTATGSSALEFNTTGSDNTANGFKALFSNSTGVFNTASGAFALFSNTTGTNNTANGSGALPSNTTGASNTANGAFALLGNTTGGNNTANSAYALFSNTTGTNNTANGFGALFNNTTGTNNTTTGVDSLSNNITGGGNVALGFEAGNNQTIGSNNVYIGAGINGVAGESNACYVASIFGQTSASGIPVLINSSNKLGTTTSSKRFKDDIKPMDKASSALFSLKPVSFRYKKEIDPAGTSQLGLVAEDVEKVNPDLVVRDKEGKPYSVRYDQVNAMLLNEFLKEHKTVQEQADTISIVKANSARQEATIVRLEKQIEALTAGLQNVSAQLELSKPTPQTVLNRQ
jgi:trimeric autotransporter adhesin